MFTNHMFNLIVADLLVEIIWRRTLGILLPAKNLSTVPISGGVKAGY